ncbi:hypothetical protein P9112_000972 [Eukaryota sp. TZLM1-RC]
MNAIENSFQLHYEAALKLIDARLFEDALVHLNKAIFFLPQNAHLICIKAELFCTLLDFKAALSCLNTIDHNIELTPSVGSRIAHCYEVLSKDCLLQRAYKEAFSLTTEAFNAFPTSHRLLQLSLLFVELYPSSTLKDGIDEYIKTYQALDLPNDSDFLLVLALIHLYSGEKHISVSHAKKVLLIKSNNNLAKQILEESRADLEDLVNRAHDMVGVNNEQGLVLIEEAIKVDPDHVRAHFVKGILLKDIGMFQSAIDELKASLELSSDDFKPFVNKELVEVIESHTDALITDDYFKQALVYLNLGLKIAPNNFKLLVSRGDVHLKLQNLMDSLLDYNHAVSIKSDWSINTKIATVHYSIGVNLFNQGRFLDAEKAFSSSISFNPKLLPVYVIRAKTRVLLGMYREALIDGRLVLSKDENNIEAQEIVGRLDATYQPKIEL